MASSLFSTLSSISLLLYLLQPLISPGSKSGNRTMAIEDEDEDEDSMALLPFGFGSASISTVGSFIRSPQCGGLPILTIPGNEIATIIIKNKCSHFIWPATITTSPGQSQLSTTGFELAPGASKSLNIPRPWTGRIWARTQCSNDIVQGQTVYQGAFRHSCLTGDCSRGSIECKGAAGVPPVMLVEFTLAKDDGRDFYDVSLVDGFNIPASITTQDSSSSHRPCASVSCHANVNKDCPVELQVKSNDEVIACKSPCLAFDQPRYCCTGEFNDPNRCDPTEYSKFFKDRCPDAYSYAYDDSSTFSCDNRTNYVITFCS